MVVWVRGAQARSIGFASSSTQYGAFARDASVPGVAFFMLNADESNPFDTALMITALPELFTASLVLIALAIVIAIYF